MPTRNLLAPRITEQDIWITNDGASFILHRPPDRVILSVEGTGIPPIQYITQRGPYQHGEALRDFFLQPRVIQMVVRHSFCDRQSYWNGRSQLLDILRPNRGANRQIAQGTLRKILPDNTVRDLTCIIQQGPAFAPRQSGQWDEWAYTETLRFVAHDPVFFEPILRSIYEAVSTPATFPMTFPFIFTGFYYDAYVSYDGNWITYPTITIKGPITAPHIENASTGQVIQLNYVVDTGRIVTIDLEYGNKTVTLDDGTNLIGYIYGDSDLVGWQLAPGFNHIILSGTDTDINSSIELLYMNRYIGI